MLPYKHSMCHTSHINPIVHFCQNSLQHVPVYGCHSGDDATDLTSCDFFLWGYVKDVVYVSPLPNDLQELRQRIIAAVTTINRDMLERVWTEMDYRIDVCRVTRGSHIECLQCNITKLWVFLTIVVYRVIVGSLVTSLYTCESVTLFFNYSVYR
jgi:hypothetical protein